MIGGWRWRGSGRAVFGVGFSESFYLLHWCWNGSSVAADALMLVLRFTLVRPIWSGMILSAAACRPVAWCDSGDTTRQHSKHRGDASRPRGNHTESSE